MNKDEIMALGVEESIAEIIFNDNEALRRDYEEKIENLVREGEIDTALRESGAKNIKVVRALIDTKADFKEQIEKLKEGADTKFLFETRKGFAPYRSGEKLPDTQKEDYSTRLMNARKAGNTLEAIRIKQLAASEGIMLI